MRPFPAIVADGHVIARDRELPEFLPDPTGGGIIHAGCMDYPRKNFPLMVRPSKNRRLERRESFQCFFDR